MLFNEPKLLKSAPARRNPDTPVRFSALQRAEIAEIVNAILERTRHRSFSALQRAEIAEIVRDDDDGDDGDCFSALQRAEIAEILERYRFALRLSDVSVLFNEPKLLKLPWTGRLPVRV